MDHIRFDALIRALTAGRSRRDVLRGLVGAGIGLGALRLPEAAQAKKKRKKKKKKRPTQSPPPLPPSPLPPSPLPPPPPGPVTTADATCSPASTHLGGSDRFAQTFVARRTGQLTSASVVLVNSAAGANFVLEIRAVDQAGAPTTTLAGTTIPNVPATGEDPPRMITGTFGSPAAVLAGQVYALAVTVTPSQGYGLQVGENNPCPDGSLFKDIGATGAFDELPSFDLVFATSVTA